MKQKVLALMVVSALAVGASTATLAATSYTLFGNASIVAGGNPGRAAQLVSDKSNITTPYGGVDLASTTVTTLSSVTFLGTDYELLAGDCGGGSPRFEIGLPSGNIFVYLGPPPNFTRMRRRLAVNRQSARWYGRYQPDRRNALRHVGARADRRVEHRVLDRRRRRRGLVVQPGGVQTVLVDNVKVNGDVVTFEPNTPPNAEACKNGGWQNYVGANGPFKNQGQCIQYVNTGK